MRWREGSAAVAGHGLLLVFFCVVKAATQPGEEPAVMAHPITVDPNSTPSRTGGDVVFQLGVKRVRGGSVQ